MPPAEIPYNRSRFSTRLVENRLYTAAHYWLEREDEEVWRVGYTKYAVRTLGDIVELGFETEPGATVETGQVVGWVEGFKAISDLYSPLAGRFEGFNPAVGEQAALLSRDPYRRGWLFRVRGRPGDDCLDVHGYVAWLDTEIDKVLGRRRG